MTAPIRIQRRRAKGWKMPEGAVYVGRPTMWGNRWKIGTHSNMLGRLIATNAEAVAVHRKLAWREDHHRAWVRENLRGKDLVCWCSLSSDCHADFLLQIANAPLECGAA
jgi:hypothetical protein